MAEHSAAFLVPMQTHHMVFSDLYSLALPLFVPDARLWVRTFEAVKDCQKHPPLEKGVQAAGPIQLGSAWDVFRRPMPPEEAELLLDMESGLFPASMYFLATPHNWQSAMACDSPEKIAAAYWLTDFANYPYVNQVA